MRLIGMVHLPPLPGSPRWEGSIDRVVAAALAPGSVLLYERHDGARLAQLEPPARVVIGPEGGFTDAEVDAVVDAGATLAALGPRILRSQTVAAAAAAVILSRTGDFA